MELDGGLRAKRGRTRLRSFAGFPNSRGRGNLPSQLSKRRAIYGFMSKPSHTHLCDVLRISRFHLSISRDARSMRFSPSRRQRPYCAKIERTPSAGALALCAAPAARSRVRAGTGQRSTRQGTAAGAWLLAGRPKLIASVRALRPKWSNAIWIAH
ncbi:hypothetical protein PHLGIDRAFT_190341 [Phlebiopsis gigantea 11061_1 CR5-6]|uniref:Uncharacterized protein n=1 Tax=Phlebiopsis gigantea (strain 11061_1 CR5-6) TaxID=745531 RepID=A0A0C3NI46_PHLG1|nr:hypothetical protein PHLGIDRAFT_190341 [Phlebiopsis gigantea 11061_1 CR5-6]